MPAELTGIAGLGGRRVARDLSGVIRREGIKLSVWLAVTAAAAAVTVALYAWERSKPHANFSPAQFALCVTGVALFMDWMTWTRRKHLRETQSGWVGGGC
jgi:hypothetical protein